MAAFTHLRIKVCYFYLERRQASMGSKRPGGQLGGYVLSHSKALGLTVPAKLSYAGKEPKAKRRSTLG